MKRTKNYKKWWAKSIPLLSRIPLIVYKVSLRPIVALINLAIFKLNVEYGIRLKITFIINYFPGILNVIPLQLLAYHIAKNRGLSVDAQSNEGREYISDHDSSLNSPEK